MKQTTFLAIAMLLVLSVGLYAGKPSASPTTITTSCGSGCTKEDVISFMGSGFKANTTITLSVDSASKSFTIYATPGFDGTFNISFVKLTFPEGDYTVTAWGTKGKSIITYATDSFSVD